MTPAPAAARSPPGIVHQMDSAWRYSLECWEQVLEDQLLDGSRRTLRLGFTTAALALGL